jgi:hypothetical protein
MSTLRSRLLGSVLLVVGAAVLAYAGTVAPAVVAAPSPDGGVPLVARTPLSLLAAPALLAAGSVLVVGGAGAVAAADRSARPALLAPTLGALAALAFGVGLAADPGALPATVTHPDVREAVVSGPIAAVAAGAVVGGAVAPVVQATVAEDAPALLAGAALLLAALAVGAADPVQLVTGGVGGLVAVGLLWAADPVRWRP